MSAKEKGGRLLQLRFWIACLLLPVVIPEAIRLRRRIPILPEAQGQRFGKFGEGPPFRLIALGESPVAGATLVEQGQSVGSQLAMYLAEEGRTVHWLSLGKTGAKIEDLLPLFSSRLPERADLVFIAMGVNDTKGLTSVRSWSSEWRALLLDLETRYPDALFMLSSVPPFGSFPALPWAVRFFLSARAALLDASLLEECGRDARRVFSPLPDFLGPEYFASDGFHPNAGAHSLWARELASLFLAEGSMEDCGPSGNRVSIP
jgi:lysophospholipase L1-like esterase